MKRETIEIINLRRSTVIGAHTLVAVLLLTTACEKSSTPNGPETELSLTKLIEAGASIMWIGAHPEDETILAGTLLAKACAELGNECWLISFASGTNGTCAPGSIAEGTCPCENSENRCPDKLGEVRSEEFRAVAALFGAEAHILNWDNKFQEKYLEDAVDSVKAIIHLHRPDLVVTHASRGGDGHSNHVLVHKAVTAAYFDLPEIDRPGHIFYALHRWPGGIDKEAATDIIDGRVYSPKLGKTYWDLVVEAASRHATQSLRVRAESVLQADHSNHFYLAAWVWQ